MVVKLGTGNIIAGFAALLVRAEAPILHPLIIAGVEPLYQITLGRGAYSRPLALQRAMSITLHVSSPVQTCHRFGAINQIGGRLRK